MNKKRISTYLLTALSEVTAVQAATMSSADYLKGLQTAGIYISGVLQNQYGVYVLTLLLSFILFYSIYSAAAKHVKIFSGEGGLGLNVAGKLFCTAATGLTCTAIFAFRKNVVETANRVLTPFGGLGILLLALTVGIIVWKSMRDEQFLWLGRWGTAFLSFLVGFAFLAWLTKDSALSGLGISLLILFVLFTIVRSTYRHFRPHRMTRRDVERAERVEQRDERHEETARRTAERARLAENRLEELQRQLEVYEQQGRTAPLRALDNVKAAHAANRVEKIAEYLRVFNEQLHEEEKLYKEYLPEEDEMVQADERLERGLKRLRNRHENDVRKQLKIENIAKRTSIIRTRELVNDLRKGEKVNKILENLEREIIGTKEEQEAREKEMVELSHQIIRMIGQEYATLGEVLKAPSLEKRGESIMLLDQMERKRLAACNLHHNNLINSLHLREFIKHLEERHEWFNKKKEENDEVVLRELEQIQKQLETMELAAAEV